MTKYSVLFDEVCDIESVVRDLRVMGVNVVSVMPIIGMATVEATDQQVTEMMDHPDVIEVVNEGKMRSIN